MYPLFATLAAIASLAAAATVPVVYLLGFDSVSIGSLTVPLVQFGLAVYIAYVTLNILSAIAGRTASQQGETTYNLDFFPSLIAALSFTITALFVGIGMASSYHDINQIINLPFAIWLLIGLVMFAWFDVGFLQGANRQRLADMASIAAAQRAAATLAAANAAAATAAANPPNPPPAPAASQVNPVTVLLVVGGFFLLALLALAFFNREGRSTLGLNDSKESVPVCSRFVGKSPDGVPVYVIHHDC